MESEAKYVLVGSFVVVATMLLVASIIWFSKATGGKESRYYTAYFKHQTLDGLQRDSYVTMKGVRVGSVSDYEISSENIEEVKVTLRLDALTPVKTDTRAVIRRNLLTGLAVVDLVKSTQSSPLLTDVPYEEKYPVIMEGRSELEKLADSLPDLLERADGIINQISTLLSEQNVSNVSKALKNIEGITGVLAENRVKMDTLLVELTDTAKAIRETSQTLHGLSKNTDKRLGEVSAETVNTLRTATQTMSSMEKRTAEISGSVGNAANVFSQEVSAMTQAITAAAGSVAKTVESFEDPRAIISGPQEKALGPGEKVVK